MAELPIACTLTPEALRTRREGLLMDLVRRAERQEDLDDGLRLEFAPSAETIALIASRRGRTSLLPVPSIPRDGGTRRRTGGP
jgi:hypothetical protein